MSPELEPGEHRLPEHAQCRPVNLSSTMSRYGASGSMRSWESVPRRGDRRRGVPVKCISQASGDSSRSRSGHRIVRNKRSMGGHVDRATAEPPLR